MDICEHIVNGRVCGAVKKSCVVCRFRRGFYCEIHDPEQRLHCIKDPVNGEDKW